MSIMKIIILMHVLSADCPNCPRDADPVEFQKAAEFYSVPADLLVIWAYFESSLDSTKVGRLGEVGLFQVHGVLRHKCEEAGLSPLGVQCGAMLIAMNTYDCGGLWAGVNKYASGKCKGTPSSRRKIRYRLLKLEKWRLNQ